MEFLINAFIIIYYDKNILINRYILMYCLCNTVVPLVQINTMFLRIFPCRKDNISRRIFLVHMIWHVQPLENKFAPLFGLYLFFFNYYRPVVGDLETLSAQICITLPLPRRSNFFYAGVSSFLGENSAHSTRSDFR